MSSPILATGETRTTHSYRRSDVHTNYGNEYYCGDCSGRTVGFLLSVTSFLQCRVMLPARFGSAMFFESTVSPGAMCSFGARARFNKCSVNIYRRIDVITLTLSAREFSRNLTTRLVLASQPGNESLTGVVSEPPPRSPVSIARLLC